MSGAEAPTLPCSSCGAPLPVNPVATTATCGNCRAVTAVPDEMRQRARAYLGAVGSEMRRISMADRMRMAVSGDGSEKLFNVFFVVVLVLAGLLTVGQMSKTYRAISVPLFIGGLLVSIAVFFVVVFRQTQREFSGASEPEPVLPPVVIHGSVQGACSSCGGQVAFAVGSPNARCPYCNATVVPPAGVQARLVAIAQERADLEEARAGRHFHRTQAEGFGGAAVRGMGSAMRALRFVMPAGIFVFIGVMFLTMGSGGTHGGRGASRAARDVQSTFQLVGAGLIGVGVLVVAGAGLVIYLVRRFSIRGRITSALQAIARRRGVKLVRDVPLATLDWLDANWATEAPQPVCAAPPVDHDGKPGARWLLITSSGGRGAALVVTEGPGVRRADVFLSAYRRREHWREAMKHPKALELLAQGLEVDLNRAGVRVSQPLLELASLTPERVDWMLERAEKIAAQ